MTSVAPRTRRISDWLGFACFAVFAGITVSKMPAVGLFLAPSLAHELFVAISFLIRDQPKSTVPSLRARLSAYGGSFLLLAFFYVAEQFYPSWMRPSVMPPFLMSGFLLWMGGSLWTAYAVWHLRHAFSIEPQARRLITSGPYRVARHPIYAGYFAQYTGMLLVFPTVPFALALIVWFALMADRMRNEEAVLARAFPEYQEYRHRVGAIWSVPPSLRRPARA